VKITTEFLVVGSGIAGLSYALKVADHGRVAVVTKREISETATNLAQGGIASVISSEDSFASHVRDTMVAGVYLSHEDVVQMVVESGPQAICDLINWGVRFTKRADESYDLGREGGHSKRRILHAKDMTGQEIERALVEAVRSHPNITIYEHHIAIDLITDAKVGGGGRPQRCLGAHVLDIRKRQVLTLGAQITVLATGGAGKVYLYTCNPDIATGDGVAMAWRAGLEIRNMEFVQFHPTCLYHPEAKSFLISEAVRGEGARLLNGAGKPFMKRYDPRAELAPRDIVARAIDNEMKTRGDQCVYLDITHKGAAFLRRRFPNIFATCKKFGFDMARQPIPVVPAAHYFCGGVAVDIHGRTGMAGLHAAGEVACTGLHGANRLASNSMLEALVCGHAAARDILATARPKARKIKIPAWKTGDAVPSDEAVVVTHNWNEVRTVMWDYVGIVRTNRRLARALRRIATLRREIRTYYRDYLVTADLLELRNIATVAKLIIQCARLRKESRGLHYNMNYPNRDDRNWLRDTMIDRFSSGF